jgi:hypothetical protein
MQQAAEVTVGQVAFSDFVKKRFHSIHALGLLTTEPDR